MANVKQEKTFEKSFSVQNGVIDVYAQVMEFYRTYVHDYFLSKIIINPFYCSVPTEKLKVSTTYKINGANFTNDGVLFPCNSVYELGTEDTNLFDQNFEKIEVTNNEAIGTIFFNVVAVFKKSL